MKRYLIPLIWVLCAYANAGAQSCCSSGMGCNWNILPNINKSTIGVRYTYRSASSVYPVSLNPEMSGRRTNETMHTAEVVGRFRVHRRLQLSVYLPISVINSVQQGNLTRQGGLGDMVFQLQADLLSLAKVYRNNSKQRLRIGAGIKLPSGHFSMDKNSLFTTGMQPGTGSVDFLLSGIYTYRYKKTGFNLVCAYKLNTINPQQFKYGDKLQPGANVFIVFKVKDIQLIPTAGLYFDYAFYNRYKGNVLDYTGGKSLGATAGFDVYYKSLAFSANCSPVLYNQMNWDGEMKQKLLAEAGVHYIF